MKRIVGIMLIAFLFAGMVNAQVSDVDSMVLRPDSVSNVIKKSAAKKVKIQEKDTVLEYKPDPIRVVWMGAIIPGYGQILNRSYWKLPIVYAGFLGCAYAVNLNSTRYQTYKLAYKDISDNNPNTKSHLDLFPEGYTIENYPGGESGLKNNLSTAYQQYRRYRDLSIIGSVAYYAIVLVEAYVDAQLFDFDISTDLSLHVRPTLIENKYGVYNSPGVQLSLNLK